MSVRRTITVELTLAEHEALCGAIARADYEWECEAGDVPGTPRRRASLDRAWRKINSAWRDKARGSRR